MIKTNILAECIKEHAEWIAQKLQNTAENHITAKELRDIIVQNFYNQRMQPTEKLGG